MQNSRERSAWYRVLKNEQKQAEKLGQLIRLASRPGINNSPDKKTSNFLETRYHQMVS